MRVTRLDEVQDPEKLACRFWAKVDRSADAGCCWIWKGSGCKGYGLFSIAGPEGSHKYLSHRVAWMLEHGEMPPSEAMLLHRCDTPACCNPAHLTLGSHQDNMDDMARKGRRKGIGGSSGESNGRAQLSAQVVLLLRVPVAQRLPDRHYAEMFGVTTSAINLARTGKTWQNVPLPGDHAWLEALFDLAFGE